MRQSLKSSPPISLNRTEIGRYLPMEATVAQVLHEQVRQWGEVPQERLRDFFDCILESLGVNPPEDLYTALVARLHTILCQQCPRVHWQVRGKSDHVWRGFVWRGPRGMDDRSNGEEEEHGHYAGD